MANTENILVPFGRHSSDLNSLYHAFALAERIRAKVFVLFLKEEKLTEEQITPLEQACLELVHSACEEGSSVSFHVATDRFETELFNIIRVENIDMVVISAGDPEMASAIKGLNLSESIMIIKVKGKQ